MKKSIIVDVERMKYPNTGLHNYCKNLMESLSKTTDFDFTFFTHKRVGLSTDKKRINRTLLDKIFLKPSRPYVLWHGTYQSAKYLPYGKIKFVLTIHDLNFLYEKKCKKKQKKLLQKVQKRIDRADYITAISKFALDDAQKHLNLKGKRTRVIYNGVNLVEYPDFNTPNYQPQKAFLFSIGTVLPKKNFHILVKLLQHDTTYELLIAGIQENEHYIAKIKAEAEKYGVQDRVKLLGAISEEEKYWYMKNCTAFLFPSIAEGFGLPVIEAMQLGKPVFLSICTSLPEIGGKYAYYFPDFEEKTMVKVLKEGLNDYQQNHRKPQIIEWASQFTWEKAANAYNEVYKEVLL